jgi:hypothetical protein
VHSNASLSAGARDHGLVQSYPTVVIGKIAFDNHLEGSSTERYSMVAEAMSNLRYHPIEETGNATIRRN